MNWNKSEKDQVFGTEWQVAFFPYSNFDIKKIKTLMKLKIFLYKRCFYYTTIIFQKKR